MNHKRIFEEKFLIHKYFRQITFPIFILIDHRYFHTLNLKIENSIQFTKSIWKIITLHLHWNFYKISTKILISNFSQKLEYQNVRSVFTYKVVQCRFSTTQTRDDSLLWSRNLRELNGPRPLADRTIIRLISLSYFGDTKENPRRGSTVGKEETSISWSRTRNRPFSWNSWSV